MNKEDAQELLPAGFEHQYPSQWEVFLPGVAWRLNRSDFPVFTIIYLSDNNIPHVRIKAGVVAEAPMTSKLAVKVAWTNYDLWYGRLFLRGDIERKIGHVVLEDLIPLDLLEWDSRPGIQHLGRTIDGVTQMGARLADSFAAFGRRFGPGDEFLLFD